MKDRPAQWLEAKSSGTQVARRSVTGIVLQFGRALTVLLTAMILARVLEPEDFGVIATILPLVVLAEMLKNLGITVAIVQSPKLGQAEVTSYFWIQVLACLGLGGLVAAVGPLWARFYDDPRMVSLGLIMGGAVFLGGFGNVHNALLRRNLLFGRITAVQLAAALTALAAAIVAGLAGLGYWALVIRQVLATLVALVAFWAICSWRPDGFSIRREALSGLKLGGALVSGQLFDFLRRNVDVILIRSYTNEAMLGYYGRAQRIVTMPVTQLLGPVMAVALPMLSRRQDCEDYPDYFENVFRFCVAAAVPFGVFTFFFPDATVRVMLGEKWIEAAPIFRGLAIAAVVLPIGNCLSINLVVYRRVKALFVMPIVAAGCAIVAYVIGIQHSVARLAELYGVTCALLLPPVVWLSLRASKVAGRRLLRILLPLALCMGAAVGAGLLVGPAVEGRAGTYPRYLAEFAAFGSVYTLTLLFGAGYWKHLRTLTALLRNRSKQGDD